MVREKVGINFDKPQTMMITNFSANHEPLDNPLKSNVIAFETKPKSGVMEYVPSKVLDYIKENSDKLEHFLKKEDIKNDLINHKLPKFYVF